MRCIRSTREEVEWRFTDLLVPATLWVNVLSQAGLEIGEILARGYANALGATKAPQRITMFGQLGKTTVTNGKAWRERSFLLVGKSLFEALHCCWNCTAAAG